MNEKDLRIKLENAVYLLYTWSVIGDNKRDLLLKRINDMKLTEVKEAVK